MRAVVNRPAGLRSRPAAPGQSGASHWAQVTVTIAEKVYRIACDDGQEEHLRRLAAEVDAKIEEMRKAFGEIGDNRLTVMAAITFLDERRGAALAHRLRWKPRSRELERRRNGRSRSRSARRRREVASAILEAADRIEAVARQLAPPPSA